MSDVPGLSIGMPVFNAEDTVASAVESLLQQTFRDFELIVSDNASTDRTHSILAALAERDPRVRVVRQALNIGAHKNFAFVLRQAQANLFMWGAADDYWAPTFLQANIEFLEGHSDYVSSVSQVVFCPPFPPDRSEGPGTFELDGSPAENMSRYVLRPDTNSRFYGVFRRPALLASWIDEPYWASDWMVMLQTLRHGKHHEVPQPLLTRGRHGASSNQFRTLRSLGPPLFDLLFPMWRFSAFVLRERALRQNPRIWLHLAMLNARHFKYMAQSLVHEWFTLGHDR